MGGIISVEVIATKIFEIRGKKVMLYRDLAELYRVSTKVLNQAVKRNIRRFPEDFMFQLTQKEKDELVTICDHLKALRFSYQLPYVFTEQGVAMLSSILNSGKAISVNIQIMRAFTQLRRFIFTNHDLRRKIEEMEKKYDAQFKIIFDTFKKLLEPPPEPKRQIGFHKSLDWSN